MVSALLAGEVEIEGSVVDSLGARDVADIED